jgi:hypothetical protein
VPNNANRIPKFSVPNPHIKVVPQRKPKDNLRLLAKALLLLVEEQRQARAARKKK